MADCPDALNYSFRRLASDDAPVKLCEAYKGKVLLIVNVASKCGYTNQYEALEKMYDELKDEGFAVLGFPANDFGGQEPGTENEIREFCRLTYGVKFPMFEKTHAKEGVAGPFYQHLASVTGEYPKWNFHKYLVDHEGRVVDSIGTRVKPYDEEIYGQVKALLEKRNSE